MSNHYHNHHHQHQQQQQQTQDRRNSVVCKFFKSGKCLSGKNCKYSHDMSSSDASSSSSSSYEGGNNSNSGSNSTVDHHHNNNTQQAGNGGGGGGAPLCKYYLNGFCKSGSKCPYLHDSKKAAAANNNSNSNNTSPNSNNTSPNNNNNAHQQQQQHNNNNNNNNNINNNATTTTTTTTINVSDHPILSSPRPTMESLMGNSIFNSPGHQTSIHPISALNNNSASFIPTIPINIHHHQHQQHHEGHQQTQQHHYSHAHPVPFLPAMGTHTSSSFRDSILGEFSSPRQSLSSMMDHGPTPKSPLLTQAMGNIALSPSRITGLSFFPNSPRTLLSTSPSSPFSPQFVAHNATLMSSSPSPFYATGFKEPSSEEDDDDDDDDDLFDFDDRGLNVIDDNYDDMAFDPYDHQRLMTKQFGELSIDKTTSTSTISSSNNTDQPQPTTSTTTAAAATTGGLDTSDPKKPLSYLEVLKQNLELPPNFYLEDDTSTTSTSKDDSKTEALCLFYLQGGCRNGDGCKFIHGNMCDLCDKPMLVPGHAAQNDEHKKQCLASRQRMVQREHIRNLECGICFESVVEKNQRFGLLSHCDHIFCLDCIREWRGSTASGAPQPLSNSNNSVRLCPMCRVNSYFIIPSDVFVSQEEKQEIIDEYKSKLSTIPCKYFNNGKGSCKFGTSCMYAHLNADGSIHRPTVRKVQSSTGDLVTLYSTQLGMFIAPLIQQQKQELERRRRDQKVMSDTAFEEYDEATFGEDHNDDDHHHHRAQWQQQDDDDEHELQ
ncbi:hypothetical protein SAMD00019534_085410 [Acytostelium subglobosum LB1]|uniref:hypothetical protein n=1 Tax=Acytostelium subglobosum LB1 TaxID=1410327 RepID=UPI000644942D|nr:hypothetical protein SAMD00019534_085410 [Acytostelium subglobosum LB1]GAM25366.1 hypothetical protein SAMD00019534_085410 [Acytostelium subglobosum LB1]|eukprot:XP_012751886.1 hypothetical protein SAMD00019534_085410 [Acytostelium subglobosum LB1]